MLRERLFATLTSAEPEVEGGFDVAEDDVPAGGLGAWLDAHARTGRTGVIFRGTLGPRHRRAHRPRAGRGRRPRHLRRPRPALDAADEQALAAWLADPDRPKVVHEVKGPLLAVWARGWDLAGVVSDTALAAYLAMPGQRSFDLADLAVRYLRRELKDAAEPRRRSSPSTGWARPRRTSPPRRRTPTCSRPSRSTTSPTRWSRCSASAAATGCSARSSCR